jgi:hypothetical protein
MGVKLGLSLYGKGRFRVFLKKLLMRIFEHKRDEVTRDWRKLRKEELHNFYSSPNMVKL